MASNAAAYSSPVSGFFGAASASTIGSDRQGGLGGRPVVTSGAPAGRSTPSSARTASGPSALARQPDTALRVFAGPTLAGAAAFALVFAFGTLVRASDLPVVGAVFVGLWELLLISTIAALASVVIILASLLNQQTRASHRARGPPPNYSLDIQPSPQAQDQYLDSVRRAVSAPPPKYPGNKSPSPLKQPGSAGRRRPGSPAMGHWHVPGTVTTPVGGGGTHPSAGLVLSPGLQPSGVHTASPAGLFVGGRSPANAW